jgi:glycosyltransferase involved in cell wall biosynthesis
MVLSIMGSDAYGSYNKKGKRMVSSYLNMFLTQIALLFSTHIVVKSKNILRFVPYKSKTTIIPNGVDFRVFKPISAGIKKVIVLCLANPSDARKNVNLVKNAMQLINNQKLKLLNPFPISHNQFPAYLNNSSVFVLTSYNEGSPNVIKEAMACNIPIVSTNVGDVEEVIGQTKGCFITSLNPYDVAEKIKQAIRYGKRTNGRTNIAQYEASSIAKKIIKIYDSIIE